MKYTCRFCGGTITELTAPRQWGNGFFHWWSHRDSPSFFEKYTEDDARACPDGEHNAAPSELCCFTKTDGDDCTKKVKHEDLTAKNFACGVHMKNYLVEKRRSEEARKAEKKRAETEEILAWELSLYQQAFDRLNESDPELLEGHRRPQKTWRGFDRTVEIDIIKLERWMRSVDQAPVES